jgi:hypothetical protein
MESPTATDDNMTLHASRTVIKEDDAPPSASASGGSASFSETANRAAAPQVVAVIDWKKWIPWIIGFLVLLLILWLVTRKRGAGGGGTAA